ncbi:hypothetical protein BOX15_Mlig008155g1 [Macrostomum lignano]|uniref:Transglutaminase-like domain-containing protein n=1 Tax=Macrostomum lignano TaxID=282301 RepID=A0A267EW30_9PLAT|nr:hypothetical protein BOX15_Mlig008155g1 [Macrostomum lignano]
MERKNRRDLGDKLSLLRHVPRFVKSGKRNFTDYYDQVSNRKGMVVRRGEQFFLDMEFDEQVDDKDLFGFDVVTTSYGVERLERKWFLKERPTKFSDDESYHCPIQIRTVIVYPGSNKATAVFITSPNCIVAKYWIKQLYVTRKVDLTFCFDVKFSVSVIFNPFHPNDSVYMENDDEREEYVMEDEGRVYFGSSRNIGSRAWYFGQFDDPVLDCAYLLLAKSDLPLEQWGDPVEVARTLSALVNSNDDAGVLVGNWSGDYSEGVSPTEWKSSVPIITQYYESQEPVCFGQCWVFSGVLTTFARALGIPARSVTNFDSAHDTNGNLIVDHYFDDDLTPVAGGSADSIWNFHVWNDLWMARPDLGDDFNGWQAVDATPQEQSQGVYRTGPSPLRAIKEGLVELPFDTPFVFAEVNACIKHWVRSADGSLNEVFSDPTKVGQFVSTKAVGSSDRQDITLLYKYPEGSREEQAAFDKASGSSQIQGKGDRRDDNKGKREVKLNILTQDVLVIGNDLTVVLEINNEQNREKVLNYGFCVHLKKYNGKNLKDLAHEKGQVTVAGHSSANVEVQIKAQDYAEAAGQEEVGIEIVAMVVQGNDKQVSQTIVNLVNPEMEISISGEVAQNRTFHFQCVFVNNLPFDLTEGRFSIDGPGLRGKSLVQKVGLVKQGDKAKCSITLNPARAGNRVFIASFNSKEFKGVTREYPVYVEPDPNAVVEDEIIPVHREY